MNFVDDYGNGLADVLERSDAPCFVLPERLAEEVTGFHVHRGALASLERRALPSVADVLAEARSVLVLEDIVDHTNVGAIFRCGAALGFDAVLLAPRCADPLYRRSIKVAMGAVFSVPYARMEGWYDGLAELSDAGFTTIRVVGSGKWADVGLKQAIEAGRFLLYMSATLIL